MEEVGLHRHDVCFVPWGSSVDVVCVFCCHGKEEDEQVQGMHRGKFGFGSVTAWEVHLIEIERENSRKDSQTKGETEETWKAEMLVVAWRHGQSQPISKSLHDPGRIPFSISTLAHKISCASSNPSEF
jgi:hypothetical protein